MANIYFIADRTDGLGERLRAILNAAFLSQRFGGEFFFDWRLRLGRQAAFNAVCDVEGFFHPQFVRNHLLSHNQKILCGIDEVPLDHLEKYKDLSGNARPVKFKVNQAPIYRYVPGLKADLMKAGLMRTFKSFRFSDTIQTAINSATSITLPLNPIAVHLRAGDIVYGIYSKYARFCGKAIPYQIAEEIVNKITSRGEVVLLFGQDSSIVDYISDKYGAIPASSLISTTHYNSTQVALAEIILMSRCRAIVSGGSGFASLASSLAGDISLSLHRTLDHLPDIVLRSLDSEVERRISLEQQIFSLRWVIGNYATSLSSDSLRKVCQAGLQLAPSDVFFSYVLASCLIDEGYYAWAGKVLYPFQASRRAFTSEDHFLQSNAYGSRQTAARILPPLYSFLGLKPLDNIPH